MQPAPTVRDLLASAAGRLAASSDSPILDAELLLAECLGWPRTRLKSAGESPVAAAAADAYAALLARRLRGEPVAYLLGRREFWTLTLQVGPGVLVPRPDTELLVERALAAIREVPAPRVLDLGTGSGALGLALASERPDARVELVDASESALAIAAANARALGLANASCRCADWYEGATPHGYHAIVSNPPYLAADDPHLADPALRHEPRTALVAGPTGLESLAHLAHQAGAHLVPGGWLGVEHGATQGAAVRALLADAGLVAIATHRDLAGLERVSEGRAPARTGLE